MKHITDIFKEHPGWGLRGDKYLWDDLKNVLNHHSIPDSEREFKNLLDELFLQLTGKEIGVRKDIQIDRYESGGMSGGIVSSEHWQDYIFPKLVERFSAIKEKISKQQIKSSKEYNPDIYVKNEDNSCRYALGTKGLKPLIVFGINPSIADNKIGDPTARKIKGFSKYYGYDSYLILNLYPRRTTDPKQIDFIPDNKIINENIRTIDSLIPNDRFVSVLAAWGKTIEIRDYFKLCIREIAKTLESKKIIWLKIGELTKNGHPRHPSIAPYNSMITSFNFDSYIEKL